MTRISPDPRQPCQNAPRQGARTSSTRPDPGLQLSDTPNTRDSGVFKPSTVMDIKATGNTLGDANAPVTMEVYADFQCPICGQFDRGTLVWTDIYDEAGHYLVYDVETGRIEDHALRGVEYKYPGYSQKRGDRVYSINFRR